MVSIINPEELVALQQNENLILVDVRTGPEVREKYKTKHLRGAIFSDLETELAHKKENAADGGRHPLPDANAFAEYVGKIGIGPESTVVAYDDKSGANAAARFWWMLRALGHENVAVLNGGMEAAITAGFPVSSSEENITTKTPYPNKNWKLPLVTIEEVEKVAQNPEYLVIDVRDGYRYRGESEPIDLIAGHIPGAVNIPFSENLNAQGNYLPAEELKQKYTVALANRSSDQVIVHCGSGVTACHTLLAIDYAGLPIPKMYVGSWSEWSRTERPIGTSVNP